MSSEQGGQHLPEWIRRTLARLRPFLKFGAFEVNYAEGEPRQLKVTLTFTERSAREV